MLRPPIGVKQAMSRNGNSGFCPSGNQILGSRRKGPPEKTLRVTDRFLGETNLRGHPKPAINGNGVTAGSDAAKPAHTINPNPENLSHKEKAKAKPAMPMRGPRGLAWSRQAWK
jgi:hypothetical protein